MPVRHDEPNGWGLQAELHILIVVTAFKYKISYKHLALL